MFLELTEDTMFINMRGGKVFSDLILILGTCESNEQNVPFRWVNSKYITGPGYEFQIKTSPEKYKGQSE